MTLDSKAPALAVGMALLLNSAGCGSNDKGDSPKVATTNIGHETGGGFPPPGPATNGLPYGDGTPGDPPSATVGSPKPIDLAPRAKDAPAEAGKDEPKKDAPAAEPKKDEAAEAKKDAPKQP